MRVNVELGARTYPIEIGAGAVRELPAVLSRLAPTRLVLVSDENVARHHLKAVTSVLPRSPVAVIVRPGEASKSLGEAAKIFELLAGQGVGRDSLLLALGGGVVGDLGGFIAATWQRGIPYVQLPTSLEAAIDASVGGKTAVNLIQGKNLVGAFHQPQAVLIDLDFLPTLPQREWTAALAESVKHAVITPGDFLEWHEAHADAICRRDPAIVMDLIGRNCRIKADIVAVDERETTGRREFLNYGHTIGHAIEGACGYALRHGECVALGIEAENHLAAAGGLLAAPTAARIGMLLQALGLPTICPIPLRIDDVLDACRRDKKNRDGRIAFALVEDIGLPGRHDGFADDQIRRAIAQVISSPRD